MNSKDLAQYVLDLRNAQMALGKYFHDYGITKDTLKTACVQKKKAEYLSNAFDICRRGKEDWYDLKESDIKLLYNENSQSSPVLLKALEKLIEGSITMAEYRDAYNILFPKPEKSDLEQLVDTLAKASKLISENDVEEIKENKDLYEAYMDNIDKIK